MRLLKADEIECRVGQKKRDGSKYSVLLYKTARCDMAILDELYGVNGWRNHYEMVGDSMFCTIEIWDSEKQMWIAKQSNGSESNMEAEKGQASDCLKRAGFMLGIGRELYTAPQIWLDSGIDQYSLEVSDIGYDSNNRINKLVIKSKGKAVFELGKYIKTEPKKEPVEVPEPRIEATKQEVDELSLKVAYSMALKKAGTDMKRLLEHYGVEKQDDLTLGQWVDACKIKGIDVSGIAC